MSYPYPLSNERLSKTEWVLYTRVYFKRCAQCHNAFVCNIAKADGGVLESLEGRKPWTAYAPTRRKIPPLGGG